MTETLSRGAALKLLQNEYGLTDFIARRVLEIANEFGRKAQPCDGGFVHVVYCGWSDRWPYTERFRVYDHTGKVAPARPMSYNKSSDVPSNHPITNRKKTVMPPRGRRAAAAPVEPEEVEEEQVEESPFDKHLTKDLSPTMSDYGDWFHENVADIEDLGKNDPYRLLALGSTLYPHFQKSPTNLERREARKAERAAAAPVVEEEVEEEAPPARPARKGTKPAAAPARAAATPKPAAPKPAGRPRRAAASAPY